VFGDFEEYQSLLRSVEWPGLDDLNSLAHVGSPRFEAQTPALLGDGLHYEARINLRGQIATRRDNWHDLLNALVWLRYPALKQALNARQVADIATVGPRERTRAQCALTLFDEGGVIVVTNDDRLMEAWDRHDWSRLFGTLAASWQNGARVMVFGHALLEHALEPPRLLVAKALVLTTPGDPRAPGVHDRAVARLAAAISGGTVLCDPQELRPLPVSGLPGWDDTARGEQSRDQFLSEAECFRPRADGRTYPAPLQLEYTSTDDDRPRMLGAHR